MSPPDAQTYWISTKIHSDQFLLYCFEDSADSTAEMSRSLIARAALVADLRLKVRDVPFHADYPYWVPMDIGADHVVAHEPLESWPDCLLAVGELLTERLDSRESPWRLHLFAVGRGAPRCGDAPAVVAVLQVAHALADGRGASALARALFGGQAAAARRSPRPAPWRPVSALALAAARLPAQLASLAVAAVPAHRTHRELERDTAAGVLPPQPPSLPKGPTNARPDEHRSVRMVVRDAAELRGPGVTVTVGAMTAISLALTRYLEAQGNELPANLAAEVTVAKSGQAHARNHFRNVAVDLHPDLADLRERAEAIAASMASRRVRGEHSAAAAADRALRSVPGPLVRWGVEQFDFGAIPDTVTGNTVVSSVDRGPADLSLGGGRVRFTAGFPALSQFMGLTHGVHGIGDTVTIGVTTSPSVLADIDAYEAMLHEAIDEVGAALGPIGWRGAPSPDTLHSVSEAPAEQ
ncbi:WS/DGAT domain-containing protein [Rhodococcus sp. UNC363MFTsu5.1]|uniref:WS/DGAT domain-containing protein n=1 Tax=Rhodococcus sp. UNC363MFTsu5.1 TaxID=1449069 RepID=UPI0009DD3680|nr:WS/DGAT domain-containing protein [Rhodococcus sp. UNC363MFTsu5.1]